MIDTNQIIKVTLKQINKKFSYRDLSAIGTYSADAIISDMTKNSFACNTLDQNDLLDDIVRYYIKLLTNSNCGLSELADQITKHYTAHLLNIDELPFDIENFLINIEINYV